ncbi:hypothetical protein LX32DRAFT_1520 [Colletotrichum zoysiae]|uniref:Uncharacterized protein n=1 Tax=Colletotrichum zoysiae TaxID=1216348 RepID=A0AAD9HWN4_9PEZI|nr:hypothetical protein LX32DRAFT_1520 [Colletotrichum zoysiae]
MPGPHTCVEVIVWLHGGKTKGCTQSVPQATATIFCKADRGRDIIAHLRMPPPSLSNGSPKLPPYSLKHGPSSPADPRHPRDTTPSSMAPPFPPPENLVWKKQRLRGPCSQRTPEPGPVLAFLFTSQEEGAVPRYIRSLAVLCA